MVAGEFDCGFDVCWGFEGIGDFLGFASFGDFDCFEIFGIVDEVILCGLMFGDIGFGTEIINHIFMHIEVVGL